MNIKSEGSRRQFDFNLSNINITDFKVINFLLGGGEYTHLKLWVLSLTAGLWSLGFIIACTVIFINDSNVFDIISNWLIVSSLVGIGLSVIGLITHDEWNREYGQGMWNRIVLYNVIMFLSVVFVHQSTADSETVEPVKSMEFKITDIDGCKYKILMRSDSLNYTYCESTPTLYKTIDNNTKINIIAYYKFGEVTKGHIEFLDKSITMDGG